MENHVIFGVHITDRVKKAMEVQTLFTQYGENIKTRLGLNHTNELTDQPLILLEMFGSQERIEEFFGKLKSIDGLQVERMIFSH